MTDVRELIEAERFEGYLDGFNLDNPQPSENRSNSYRHGFECGRADKENRPAFGSADLAHAHCTAAERKDAMR